MAWPRRRSLLAASGPLQRRRDGALLRLAALYRLLPVDLILEVLITRPNPGTLALHLARPAFIGRS
jgi:hypothetical protein